MRTGVFGGTFDPVHLGHVAMAEAAAMKFGLSSVLFLPARLSPHKTAPPTDARHRVAMLALALAGRPDWSIALDELDREGPSFTVDTLRALSARSLQPDLRLLMGTDTLAGFARWKEPAEIVRLARIAAFYRDPFRGEGLVVPDVAGLADRLDVFDAGSVRISSTELREKLSSGQRPSGLVPPSVAEYITKQGLYSAGVVQS
ncbi:MAG: nicotinate (nicotinamide) nucleotide adenylyltransferase [Acidobacteria bacterium]|nr:nicotinate (nicotinamide) nucleotide adenylyltransferase [Acidobacteriota bacterium]MCA1611826.1 nicotinate (nicotinamide) nucleotide adenylyltransferase [Acidobacteriota bacterium]